MRKTIVSIGFIIFFGTATAVAGEDTAEQIRHLLEKETIQRADAALHEKPVTVTATRATRSAGGTMTSIRRVTTGGRIRKLRRSLYPPGWRNQSGEFHSTSAGHDSNEPTGRRPYFRLDTYG